MKLFAKIFSSTSIPFALGMSLYYSIKFGITEGIIRGVIAGLLFGLSSTMILATLQLIFSKKEGADGSTSYQQREVTLNLPKDIAFPLCIDSVCTIKNCSIDHQDDTKGYIQAKVGRSWKSWGELIEYEILEISAKEVRVVLSSKPTLETIIVDYGKNAENVARISSYLQGHAK